jgi:DNA polymerase-3 subunit epsilon
MKPVLKKKSYDEGSLEHPIFVIDFEGSPTSGIVEYGLITLERGEITETRTRFCRAKAPIDPHEYRCHGIRYEETLSTLPFAADGEMFLRCRKAGPFAAHNALFEDRLLNEAYPVPEKIPRFLPFTRPFGGWGPWMDTCFLYRRCFPHSKPFHLQNLICTFGGQATLDKLAEKHCPPNRRRYHCALFDALACAVLLLNLLRHEALHSMTLEWLLIHSANGSRHFNERNQPQWF